MCYRTEHILCLSRFWFYKWSQRSERQRRCRTPELQASGAFKSQHDTHHFNFMILNSPTVTDALEIETPRATLLQTHTHTRAFVLKPSTGQRMKNTYLKFFPSFGLLMSWSSLSLEGVNVIIFIASGNKSLPSRCVVAQHGTQLVVGSERRNWEKGFHLQL